MKDISFKKLLPYLVAVVAFVLISIIYFSPLLEGKKLRQEDITRFKGMSKEIFDYRESTGEEALWTNSMFGGMPAYQISVLYKGNLIRYVDDIFQLGLPHPAGMVFLHFVGFFILLLVLRVNPWLSIIGALAFGLSSYFFIILEAGHNSKAHAIGYMAPILAGVILTFRKKYLAGGILTALFLALQLQAGHPQITYYLFLILLILGTFELASAIKEKTIMPFLKSVGILAIAFILAAATHITNLWATYEYGKYTIRGKSELTLNEENQTSGLDKDYATAWSYGISETFSLMIPNIKGGASIAMGENKKALEKVDRNFRNSVANSYQYFGNQPFTSGPVYVGAFVVFLFILGLFILEGRLKWILFTATVLSILLAWGKNFMFFTDLFLDYFPMYNKFRAVSMALVIAELTIPILAILALQKILSDPGIIKKKRREFLISLGLTAGISLLFYIVPTAFFNFLSEQEASTFASYKAGGQYDPAQIDMYVSNLEAARIYIFKADAIRSFLFILAGAALLWLYSSKKIKKPLLIAGVVIIILVDMIVVDKRYLNNDNFERKSKVENPYQLTQADQLILEDKDPNFRVYNTTVRPDQDARTSYFHKSLGGYHGAKLRRYQELIDHHISKNNIDVFNMLNTKYFIVADKNNNDLTVQRNVSALGNAWFVEDYSLVNNADEEINALNDFEPSKTAIVDKKFSTYLNDFRFSKDTLAKITLTDYRPNRLTYKSKTNSDQLAVFSEIYYDKGWNAYVDGELTPHFRANYVLRAMIIPAGEHTIEFRFEPRVYYTGEKVSLAASIVLILLVVGLGVWEYKKTEAKTVRK